MSIEQRLASLFEEIKREARINQAFADRLNKALDSTSPKEQARSNRRAAGAIDPFAYLQQGEPVLQAKLDELDIEQLKDIVAEHGMDRSKLAMKWKAKDRLVSLIVTTVANRARKGDAFRDHSKTKSSSQPNAKEAPRMDESHALTLPVYSLLLKDGTGVVFLRHGSDLWLPLFTGRECVQTYLERSGIKECQIIELPTAERLRDFLRTPPSRAGHTKVDSVVVDPIDPAARTVSLFNVEKLIASLE